MYMSRNAVLLKTGVIKKTEILVRAAAQFDRRRSKSQFLNDTSVSE